MCGGKSTTTQSTNIPPEVLARYNAVNARAEDVAATPFQRYGGQFVAPINPQQMMGINNINYAANQAQPAFNQAMQALTGEYQNAMPYIEHALSPLNTGYGQAQNLYSTALNTIGSGLSNASSLYNRSLSDLANSYNLANSGYTNALSSGANATNIGSQYNTNAGNYYTGAGSSAQPYMTQSGNYVTGGLQAANPLMAQSQRFLESGTQAVNPEEFNAGQISKYMSPYQSQVIAAQTKLAEQQNAIQRSALNSQAIGSGAFGGDRAGIAQANLAGQQSLAQQATMANLLNQGYGQALGAFQQQQGVNLQAGQANRAAQQFGQQAAAGLAQQAFGQNLAASQQMGNLGQALFGQQMAQGQAIQGLGQQAYAQNMGLAQLQSGIAQNQFGMGAQQAALQQAAAQGQFGMAAQQAALQQGIGQAQYGMGQQQAAALQQLAQNRLGMASQYANTTAGLASGAQAAALQGAQAQIGAGTLQQQTQQAQDTAQYQQFLQERGYPFQVAQFLANIAMGTGALSGSTTTTTAPNSFFSDRRLKKDIKEIGETHDGLPIYSFKYKGGDDQQRIGVMADEAREKHPDAVRRVGGVDAVDYEKIANRASEGGGVMPHRAGEGFAEGGHVSAEDLATIIAMQKQFLGPHAQGGLYGQSAQNLPGGKGIVPQASLPVARLPRHTPPQQQQSGMQQAMSQLGQTEKLGETLLGDKGLFTKGGLPGRLAQKAGIIQPDQPKQNAPQSAPSATSQPSAPSGGGLGTAKDRGVVQDFSQPKTSDASPRMGGVMPDTQLASADVEAITPPDEDIISPSMFANRGGVVPHKAGGGPLREGVLPYQSEDPYGVEAVNEAESGEQHELLGEKSGGKGGSSGPSGASQLSSAIGLAGTAAKAAPAIMEGITALAAMLPFSDERIKNGMERVGELDNGQPVYKYRIGDGPTQLGLSAQNVSKYGDPSAVHRDKDGLLHLDYDRATREYGGGVRPAFQEGGDAPKKNPLVEYRDYMIEKGLEPHVAAGIAGNIAKESNGNPTIWGDNDNSFGLFQKNIRGELPAYQKWAAENKRDMNDPKAQIDHVIERLNGPYANVYKQMRESNDPAQAAYQFAVGYERPVPATARYDERMKIAAQLAGGEYTGKGVAPQGEPRRQVAGAEYEDGKSYVDGKRVYDGGIAPPTEYKSGKPFESWGDFLTSRQFIVPLLSGVGAMASSPSRYFGGALLQGVGAAAQSYAGMEKPITEAEEKRAATGTQQAVTELTYRDLVNKAINADQKTGIILGVNVYKNGQATTVSVQEFNKALREGRPYALDPRGQYVAREELPERGSAGTAAGQPAGTPGAPGAPGQTAPQQPVYKNVDASTDKILQNNGQWISSGGTAGIDPKDMRYNPFSTAAGQASVALNQTAERNAYANAFANMDKSNLSKFATDITLPTSAYINGVIRKANGIFGADIPEITPQQIADAKVIEKISTKLAGLQDAATGQKSFASFAQWLNTVPTTANDPGSASKLIADVLVQSQMPIDKAAYLDRAQQHALDKGYVINENQAQYLGRGLEQNFQQSMARQYALEKQQLSKMLFEPLSYKDASGKQVNGTVIGYLTSTGGYAPAGMLKAMKEKGYSPELLRYFGGRS